VPGTNGWSFFSALRQHARFLSPKEFQPSPQHNFLRRESAARVFSLLYQLSYSDLRRWQDSNLRPSTYEVTRAFTTPQTLGSFSAAQPFYFIASCTRTPIAPGRQRRNASPNHAGEEFREELAFTESGFAPEPWASPVEVTVNFTIPGHLSRGGLF
jgi:hypothetical protein